MTCTSCLSVFPIVVDNIFAIAKLLPRRSKTLDPGK